MLNNISNFFNLIRGRKVKKTLAPNDMIAIGVRNSVTQSDYQPAAIFFKDLEAQIAAGVTPVTPTLQQVVNQSNTLNNFGGIGQASITSVNFTNDTTLYLNNDNYPGMLLVDNLNTANTLQIDIDALILDGVSYNWSSIVAGGQFTYEIGQYVVSEGGVIMHRWLSTLPNGTPTAGATQNYIVVDLNDLSSSAQWATLSVDIPNVESTFDGQTNTANLIAAGAASGITVGTAAQVCDVSVAQGKSDWYLPAIDELNKLYQNRWEVAQGINLAAGTQLLIVSYWSSTEISSARAWTFSLTNGFATNSNKNITGNVRAVRRFSI